MAQAPPFKITPEILSLVSRIERLLGQVETSSAILPEPKLRKENRIRTIKDSLAIEGNTLSVEQVTAIFENKRVLGPRKEILEVQNAIKAYSRSTKWNPSNENDFLKAHRILMHKLLDRSGKYRSGAVGVLKGSKVSHIAPPSSRLPELMGNLFKFIEINKKKLSPLILSAIAHYEIEFIHPFEDGNGRIGRLWQHVILRYYHPAFEVVPFESLIRENQTRYYRILEKCDKAGDSTEFILFSLGILEDALKAFLASTPKRRLTSAERIEVAKGAFSNNYFTRKSYSALFPGISGPTASRDLAQAVADMTLIKCGEFNKTEYRFKSK